MRSNAPVEQQNGPDKYPLVVRHPSHSGERRGLLFSGPTLGLPDANGANRWQTILTVLAVPIQQIHALSAYNVVGRLGNPLGEGRGDNGPER